MSNSLCFICSNSKYSKWSSGQTISKKTQLKNSPVHCETPLDIVDDSEVLSSLFDLHDVHETSGELGVGPGLPIDLDQPLLHNRLHLFHAQGILHPVPRENSVKL